ncbi:MAG: methyltransferase [Chitinophagales bacterium]
MKSISRFFAHHVFRPLLERYLASERTYRYSDFTIKILPGVFHPAFFFSTKFLLAYLLEFKLEKKSLLELGAGSGLISFAAERHGAVVTATDLGRKSVENLILNKSLLKSGIRIIHSDLFDKIPVVEFDYIVVNPPYYPKQPDSDAALAWYCGANFEYFEKLFSRLDSFLHAETKSLMVLSEDCDLQRISAIAFANKFLMNKVKSSKFWWEWNYIFEIKRM